MVKNVTGGNKTKFLSRGKLGGTKKSLFVEPNYADGDIIGIITKHHGSGRFDVRGLYLNTISVINCSVSRKIRICINDIVCINLLRDKKSTDVVLGVIITKYSPDNLVELRAFDDNFIKHNKLTRPNIIKILKHEKSHEDSGISELFDSYKLEPEHDSKFILKPADDITHSDINIDDI